MDTRLTELEWEILEKEEYDNWTEYDDEDLTCIIMHGMTCGEYQDLIEDVEQTEKLYRMLDKETTEAKWDFVEGIIEY